MVKESTCVVLGGTGFVGQSLVARLAERGHNVIVPTRNRERARSMAVTPRVKLVTANVHEPEALVPLFVDADVVINLVGILNEQGHHGGKGFYVAHEALTKTALEAAKQAGVKRFLQMSALKADSKKGPSDYLKSKGLAEDAIRSMQDAPEWTIFQPSVIFGAGDSFINRFAQLLKISPFLPLARPSSRFAPVFVDDVVEAFMKALDDRSTIGQTYQLCGPKVYSLRELVTYVRDQLGLTRWIIGLPDSLAKIQAAIFDFVPGKPLSTDNLRSLMVHSICDDNGLERLGIRPTPMETIVPTYLQGKNDKARLARLRRNH
ncbi:MAG: complex I NDUFA9 subunit family protein [Pseudomonadota bacterium]